MIYTRKCVRTYLSICGWMHAFKDVRMYVPVCLHVSTCECMCVRAQVCMYTRMLGCIYIDSIYSTVPAFKSSDRTLRFSIGNLKQTIKNSNEDNRPFHKPRISKGNKCVFEMEINVHPRNLITMFPPLVANMTCSLYI